MVAATQGLLQAHGGKSQLAHRLAPIAGIVGVTGLLVVSAYQLLKPAPQIRSCALITGGYGSTVPLRCVQEPGDSFRVLGKPLAPRGSIDGYLTPGARAAEAERP